MDSREQNQTEGSVVRSRQTYLKATSIKTLLNTGAELLLFSSQHGGSQIFRFSCPVKERDLESITGFPILPSISPTFHKIQNYLHLKESRRTFILELSSVFYN